MRSFIFSKDTTKYWTLALALISFNIHYRVLSWKSEKSYNVFRDFMLSKRTTWNSVNSIDSLREIKQTPKNILDIQMSGTGNGHSTKFPLSITARSMYDLLINSIFWLQYERNTLFDFRCWNSTHRSLNPRRGFSFHLKFINSLSTYGLLLVANDRI